MSIHEKQKTSEKRGQQIYTEPSVYRWLQWRETILGLLT